MKHLESQIQKECIRWFRFQVKFKNISKLLFAVPNGGKRNAMEAARLKDEGVTAGVSDMILLYANFDFNALCIEVKVGKGVQSDKQKDWQKVAELHGNKYVIVRSIDDFMTEIHKYLN